MTAFQPKSYLDEITPVWDDVLHHGTFNNLAVVELAVSKHNREGGASHVTVDELHWFTPFK